MTRKVLCFIFVGLLSVNVYAQSMTVVPKGSLITGGEDKILIIDTSGSENGRNIIWKWSFDESKDQLPSYYHLQNFDDHKLIDHNTKLLLTAGGGSLILDIISKKIEFYALTHNAHSIDLLPGGYIVIANSLNPKGNRIELYPRDVSEKVFWEDSLYSAHGVVWNKKKKKLYVLGYNQVREYAFKQGKKPHLILKKTYKTPDNDGHDLSLVDENRLIVTTAKHVYMFDIKKGTFKPFKPLYDIPGVKSVNYDFKTENLVYTKGGQNWWTHEIIMLNPSRTFHVPDVNLYKVRVAKK